MASTLATLDGAPDTLALAITEGALMRDPRGARQTLEPLRDMGVTVVIDDLAHRASAHLLRTPRADFVQNRCRETDHA